MGKGPRVDCSKDEPITQQSGRDDADINVIVARSLRGALPPPGRGQTPMYGDFTQVPTDLREVLLMVKRADDLFMSLDPFVRRRFNNDPAEMLDFLNDSKNRDEAVKLGLVKAPIEPVVAVDPKIPAKGADSSAAR